MSGFEAGGEAFTAGCPHRRTARAGPRRSPVLARLKTVYAEALVASLEVPAENGEQLRAAVTQIFEAGLAVGLELAATSR